MTTSPLAERVEHLERQLGFWRLSVLCLAVLCLAAFAARLNAAPDRIEARIIAAQQFDLIDANSHVLGRMTRDIGDPGGGAGFLLLYPNQKPAVGMLLSSGLGPRVSLFDADGRSRAAVSFSDLGPRIELFDEARRPIIAMEIGKKGPRFLVFDKALTRVVWAAP